MILTGNEILNQIDKKSIVIQPFNPKDVGANSYDIHLGLTLGIYIDAELDAKKHNKIRTFEIPKEGFLIMPSTFYLGVTLEYTETHEHIPFLEGKSSTGRLGIDIHATAGKGDIGFCGNWTLEISCKQPVRIYAGMPIGQLIYFPPCGDTGINYADRKSSKYSYQKGVPVESMMWKNFPENQQGKMFG